MIIISELNIKHALMLKLYSIIQYYITKQLEYVTKDYIATHAALLNLQWFYSLFLIGTTVLSNIILVITTGNWQLYGNCSRYH